MANTEYNSRAIAEGILVKKDPLEGTPFWVIDYMIQNSFESILYYFKYTNEEAWPNKDPFHEFGHMLRMWNENTDQYFIPGWITCIG